MPLEVIDRFPAELNEIALSSSHATFYHSAAWIESLSQVYPSMDIRCITESRDGGFTGYLPFFVVKRKFGCALWSMPFGTYGGPVAQREDGEADLLSRFFDMRGDHGVHEIGLVTFRDGSPPRGFEAEAAVTHIIDLDGGFEEIWRGFDKAKRRQVRKAEREGIEIVEASSAKQVRDYYRIYQERSDEWGQRLRYPESLFTELFSRGDGNVRLFLAYRGDELLGGHFNFYFKDTVTAWNGVTTKGSRSVQASTLLYRSCILHACEHGYRHYNLGSSLGKKSLMEYKESLGGAPRRYHVFRWQSAAGKIVTAARKFLPRW